MRSLLLRLLRSGDPGRHQLGAAVTDIPSLTGPVAVAAPVPTTPEPDGSARVGPLPAVPAQRRPARVDAPPSAVGPLVPYELLDLPGERASSEDLPSGPPLGALVEWGSDLPLVASAPRVALGFRDGTETALEPGSVQALALEALAQRLVRPDAL